MSSKVEICYITVIDTFDSPNYHFNSFFCIWSLVLSLHFIHYTKDLCIMHAILDKA